MTAGLPQFAYNAALRAVGRARRHSHTAEPALRSREICRASAVLTELALAANRHPGGTTVLCDYMRNRLIEAKVERSDAPLAEVSRLLGALLEGTYLSQ